MNFTSLPSESVAVVGVIDPDVNTAGTYLTAAIDMSKFESIMAIIMAGDMVTASTINAKFVSSDASGGTYADVTGKAITALTKAGTDDNKQAILNLRASKLASGHRFVKLSFTVAVADSDSGAIVLGFNPSYTPVSGDDLASVDEIVN